MVVSLVARWVARLVLRWALCLGERSEVSLVVGMGATMDARKDFVLIEWEPGWAPWWAPEWVTWSEFGKAGDWGGAWLEMRWVPRWAHRSAQRSYLSA